jgi:hypothetical protein
VAVEAESQAVEIAPVAVEAESQAVEIAQAAEEPERDLVAEELERDLVAEELERDLAAEEPEHGPVVVVPVQGHRHDQLVAVLKTKLVIGAHRRDRVPIAAVDLVVEAETTREPAAIEAVVAWAAVVTAVAVAAAAEAVE